MLGVLGFFLRHLILVSRVSHFHVHPCATRISGRKRGGRGSKGEDMQGGMKAGMRGRGEGEGWKGEDGRGR